MRDGKLVGEVSSEVEEVDRGPIDSVFVDLDIKCQLVLGGRRKWEGLTK